MSAIGNFKFHSLVVLSNSNRIKLKFSMILRSLTRNAHVICPARELELTGSRRTRALSTIDSDVVPNTNRLLLDHKTYPPERTRHV